MTQLTIELIIRVAVAVVMMILLGNGCVVWFNHMPTDWFSDRADDGSEARVLPEKLIRSLEEGRQRLPSSPWKLLFTGFFGIAGIYLAATDGVRFEIGALLVLTVVLEMAVSDALYRIVPDQLMVLLAISSVGFAGFYDEWWEPAAGLGVAALLAAAMYGLGRLLYKRETIGGADIKFYLGIGLVTGRIGVAAIFIMTSVFTLLHALYIRTALRQSAESVPMLPSAFAATAIYMLFLWNRLGVIGL